MYKLTIVINSNNTTHRLETAGFCKNKPKIKKLPFVKLHSFISLIESVNDNE